jgi:hypothetical protein
MIEKPNKMPYHVSNEQVFSAYKGMLLEKTCKDIAFHGAHLPMGGGLCVMNKEELYKDSKCFSSATYLKENCKTLKAHCPGVPDRKFHLIAVNFTTEDEPMDTMACMLFGFLVTGLVFAFDTKKERDKFASTLKLKK